MDTNNPTLRDLLRAAEVMDVSPRIQGFKVEQVILKTIKRVVDVIHGCDSNSKRHQISLAVLLDARLDQSLNSTVPRQTGINSNDLWTLQYQNKP